MRRFRILAAPRTPPVRESVHVHGVVSDDVIDRSLDIAPIRGFGAVEDEVENVCAVESRR